MRVRRCAIVTFDPRERLEFDLARLAEGESGLSSRIEWIALAAHLGDEVVVTTEEAAVLGSVSPTEWSDLDTLAGTHPQATLTSLAEKKLLIVEDSDADARDRQLRDANWRTASAVMHYASRWRGIDTEAMERQFTELSDESLLDRLGPPPPLVRERADPARRIRLPAAGVSPLDDLLSRRATCRNFDTARALTIEEFAGVLHRTYGARAVDDFAPGVQLLKKGVPSAGGLHATEAYLLIQRVAGVHPGLYHYHPVEHALEPILTLTAPEAATLARRFVAGQRYFVDAHAYVIPVARFRRNFWKYRNHAKAYRTLILDVGHLSQTMYLAATELGLAAFITAAVNEIDIEEAFGLDALEEGPLAVCGFGVRAQECREVEFDPLHAVWKKD